MSSLSNDIDKNIERFERSVKVFSDVISVFTDIEKKIRERREKRSMIEALIELVDAVSVNIEDIDEATSVLEDLAPEAEVKLSAPEAGRLERSMKFAKANLSQIGETLVTANEIAGSRFPLVRALLRSLENQYNDLLTILRDLPTPTSANPQIDVSLRGDLHFLRDKKKSSTVEVQRIKSRFHELL